MVLEKLRETFVEGGPIKTPTLAIIGWVTWSNLKGVFEAAVLTGTALIVVVHVINLLLRQWCPFRRQWPRITAATAAATAAATTATAAAVAAETAAIAAKIATRAVADAAGTAAETAATALTADPRTADPRTAAVAAAAVAAKVTATAATAAAVTTADAVIAASNVTAVAVKAAAALYDYSQKARESCANCRLFGTFLCPTKTQEKSNE